MFCLPWANVIVADQPFPDGCRAYHLADRSRTGVCTEAIRIINIAGSDFFSSFLRKNPNSVTRYPRIAFGRHFEKTVHKLNLMSVVNNDILSVEFINQTNGYQPVVQNKIGRITDAREEGAWHHVEVDMVKLLNKRHPATSRFYADYFGTRATSPRDMYSNPHGVSLWVDNVTFYSDKVTWQLKSPEFRNIGSTI